jgi:hypothetical protein
MRSTPKLLDCAACGKPTRAAAEATRVLCDTCAAAGRDFPRARQLDLFDSPDTNSIVPSKPNPSLTQPSN